MDLVMASDCSADFLMCFYGSGEEPKKCFHSQYYQEKTPQFKEIPNMSSVRLVGLLPANHKPGFLLTDPDFNMHVCVCMYARAYVYGRLLGGRGYRIIWVNRR